MSFRSLILPLAILAMACSGDAADSKEGDDDDAPIGDDDDDTTGDDDDDDDDVTGDDDDDDGLPTGDTGEPLPVVLSAPEILYALPNVDNAYDFAFPDATDDELEPLEIVLSEAPADTLRLSIRDTQFGRVWHDGAVVAEATADSQFDAELPWTGGTVEVLVELGLYDVDADLLIEELDASGTVLASTTTRLRASPMILNHHLQDSEFVVAVDFSFFGTNNNAFLQGFTDVLGADFEAAPGGLVDQDVWMQDEIEFATGTLPDGRRMDAVIDSIRDRGLDPYAEDRWQGEQFGVARFGRMRANTYDSFGNFEVAPPTDGYPMGRIYYGSVPSQAYFQPNDTVLTDFLKGQQIQEPMEVDTSWLCVGHVDEFMSFIVDETAPRGFRLLYTDTNAAWDFLDTLDPNAEIPRYAGGGNHGIRAISEIVDDNGLRNLNDDLQADYLDPILAQLTADLALTPDEIILFPGLFEEPRGCGRYVAALIPGMVNLVSTNFGGQDTLFMADPYLREDVGDQATDPLIAHVRSLMPSTTDVVFLDDWEAYHLALGEVHCGSNTIRTPAGDWWTDDPGGHQ